MAASTAEDDAPRWRYMTIDKASVDWLKDRATRRSLQHGSQAGLQKGTSIFGAICTEEEWRQLKLGVDVKYERS